ncbi:putative pentatricopeptide repeat-containing protein At1g56570 isoform X1 [Primulina tabacum]|uniref:putative pentatricopeptide repeat-containing protein At1g56570 isoform X1 n=1 Tax=Primulina tabacum TaxID=48773 RepID=UPI003F5A8A3F
MISRKLVQYGQIPPKIRRSLHYGKPDSTNLFNPPFVAKPPSFLATNVIKSYFDAGLVIDARTLFDEMPERDVVSWTAMISGYISCNLHSKAWAMFRDMLRDGVDVHPNEFTLSSVIKACKGMNSLKRGALVHGLAIKNGVTGNLYVDNALMDMYAVCCDCIGDAFFIFEEISTKNSVSWTTLIAGYTHFGNGYGALHVFKQMLPEAELNPFTISIAIKACTSIGSHVYGRQIHATVVKHGFNSSIPVMNSVLDMYSQCVGLSEAYLCFLEMVERDIITWNTLIAGYEKSHPFVVLNLYTLLELEGLTPNHFTFTSVVASVANIAVLSCGEQVHGRVLIRGLCNDVGTANALIDMYAKCGSIVNSCKIFDEMRDKNVVSWTSMMIGYGSHGYGKNAVQLFDQMIQSGVNPDRLVFVAVLNACSHAGLVDEGLRYFKSMIAHYKIIPDQEIYGCVVDLLGRAGRVKEAYKIIESMPFMPDESVWAAFLGACKEHKTAELGKFDAKNVLNQMPSFAGTYLAVANIYAADGKWGDFAKIRRLLRGMGSKKAAGKSWIEVKNQIYSFVAGDKFGSHIELVYEIVDLLGLHMKELRCHPVQVLDKDLIEGT